jgi:thiamine biosynthesis protein ThiS
MTLTVNGEPKIIAAVATVGGLLDHFGVSHQTVAVMVDGVIIAREHVGNTLLREGASIEIIRFVGGG